MTIYGTRAVVAIYVGMADNYDDEQSFANAMRDRFAADADMRHWELPNRVTDWGPSVVRDHLDTMRFTSQHMTGANELMFCIRLDDGTVLPLTDGNDVENGLRDYDPRDFDAGGEDHLPSWSPWGGHGENNKKEKPQ